jgi:hypothetical protein
MMYKDKNKQKKADRERARRYRERQKGVTESGRDAKGVTVISYTDKFKSDKDRGMPNPTIVIMDEFSLPANFGQRDGEGVTEVYGEAHPVVKEAAKQLHRTNQVLRIQDTPEFSIPNFGQPDCECMHCRQNRRQGSHHILNHGPHKPASELSPNELNRVALPGDVDYTGVYQG